MAVTDIDPGLTITYYEVACQVCSGPYLLYVRPTLPRGDEPASYVEHMMHTDGTWAVKTDPVKCDSCGFGGPPTPRVLWRPRGKSLPEPGMLFKPDEPAPTFRRSPEGGLTVDKFTNSLAMSFDALSMADPAYLKVTVQMNTDNGSATYQVVGTNHYAQVLYLRRIA